MPSDTAPLSGRRQLVEHHASGERPAAEWRIGTEYEKIVVHRDDSARLPYLSDRGRPGIRTLLDELSGCCGWRPGYEGDAVIALYGRDASVTLEPGGQFELSGAPFQRIKEIVLELRRHEVELEHLSDSLPVTWLWAGMDPIWGLEEIPWMPKARYGIMREYLPTRGRLALWMMQATCTVQANLDYADEADMGRKLRASMGLSSLVTAMFANSPFQRLAPSGFKSYRAHIWEHTDPDRCGLLPWVFDGELPTYERYVDYALGVPLFFIVRDKRYLPCAGLPFEQLLAEGFQGHGATLDDWVLHLSTLFPEVRLKTYLEMRSADVVGPRLLPALPALWKGLMYDRTALDAAWDLVKRWSFEDRLAHRHAAAQQALAAPVPGASYPTRELALEVLEIARYGLARVADRDGYADEGPYLDPLEAEVAAGRCPADRSLDWYASASRERPLRPRDFVEHYERTWV